VGREISTGQNCSGALWPGSKRRTTHSICGQTSGRQVKLCDPLFKRAKPEHSSGTDVYPHMPILRPNAAWFHERRISSVACSPRALWTINRTSLLTSVSLGLQAWLGSYSSDFWLLGEQSSPKWEIPCTGCRRTAVQNLTPLALSSTEKSVTAQTDTQNYKPQTVNRYIHTLPIGMYDMIL